MISYEAFLNRIVDDGIEAAKQDYAPGRKLDGSVAGFLACRGKTPEQLVEFLGEARKKADFARELQEDPEEYWYFRCFEAEVEWVVNCVSAVLVNEGRQPLTSYHPTARAVMKVAEVIGVAPLH